MLSLHDLPEPLLLDVLEYLQPVDVTHCRAVSSSLYRVLTTQDVCRHLLLSFFPCALEGRLLRALYVEEHESTLKVRDTKDWSAIFLAVARRYYRLATGQSGNITTITPLKDPELLRGITPWHRFLRRPEVMGPDRVTPLQHFDPAWTYNREQGLLIYPDVDFRYRVLDVATGLEIVVPFDTQDKIVRRASLEEGVLILEWAERSAFHELNATEVAHRHFATAFDVHKLANPYDLLQDLGPPTGPGQRDGPAPKTRCSLNITFRVEWKIHYLGLPISDQDRFFSTHNSTHYALYVWQPNRSPYWEDEPLERLIVWDIRPPHTAPTADPSLSHTPEIILRLTNAELAPWRARQLDTPLLRSLSLDRTTVDPLTGSPTGHVHIHHEDHPWVSGSHAPPVPTAVHAVSTTSIPLLGHGPSWHASCVHELGSARSCPHVLDEEEQSSAPQPLGGAHIWPGAAPCWRHGDGLAITVAEVVDPLAGVRIAASTDLETKKISTRVPPRLRVPTPAGDGADDEGDSRSGPAFGHEVWARLMGKGVLAGDERWVIGEDEDGDITIMKF